MDRIPTNAERKDDNSLWSPAEMLRCIAHDVHTNKIKARRGIIILQDDDDRIHMIKAKVSADLTIALLERCKKTILDYDE